MKRQKKTKMTSHEEQLLDQYLWQFGEAYMEWDMANAHMDKQAIADWESVLDVIGSKIFTLFRERKPRKRPDTPKE